MICKIFMPIPISKKLCYSVIEKEFFAGVPHELAADHEGRSNMGQLADLPGRAFTGPLHGIPDAEAGQEGRHDRHESAPLCRLDVHHLLERGLDALPREAVERFCHRIVLGKQTFC